MKKNDKVVLTIEDLTHEGLGIGHAEGMAVFVKDTVIGDTVTAKIMKVKKTFAFAKLESVDKESPDRCAPACENGAVCGGCQLQSMTYASQLEFKRRKVCSCLERIGGFNDAGAITKPVIGMEHPFRYRNKMQMPVGTDREGRPVAGFYAGRTHSIIPAKDCLICDERCSAVIKALLGHMKKFGIKAYNEEEKKGLVRHCFIRSGANGGQMLVCIVINGTKLPGEAELVSALKDLPGMAGILINVNTEDTNVILGPKDRLVWGMDHIEESIGHVKFVVSLHSFFQVNPSQTVRLYDTVLKYAQLTGSETVWDLYCGIGSISLFLARHAGNVMGVEIVPEAIADANNNARLNGISNAKFFTGKAEEVLPAQFAADGKRADVIVLDPPRKGCDKKVLDTILEMGPDRIVYVSCDPGTLARDLKILCSGGYELTEVQPCDMFPMTVHVETVVYLSKLKSDEHVKVEVDMSEFEPTGSERRKLGTYEEIKKYILDKYGFKVPTLYISQIKRKVGVDLRPNYNPAKNDGYKQPQCTPEKEEAIMDALRYFKYIE